MLAPEESLYFRENMYHENNPEPNNTTRNATVESINNKEMDTNDESVIDIDGESTNISDAE